MERQSITLIGFSVIFGALLGLSVLLTIFYVNGVFRLAPIDQKQPLSGMEVLNNYKCNKAETKKIILGGVEDNFDSSNSEHSVPSERNVEYRLRTMPPTDRAGVVKNYDETSLDEVFSDRFDVPKRTYHGLFVVRLEELSSLKNDSIVLGYNSTEEVPYIESFNGHYTPISNLPIAKAWTSQGNLHFAHLEDLAIREPSEDRKTLLDVIRQRSLSDGDFFVDVTDDTVVDFIGFALCLEPEVKKGTVYSTEPHIKVPKEQDFGDGLIGLYPATIDGKICIYGGCLSCQESRPLACIRDENISLPVGHAQNNDGLWSGGEIAFTRPVKGNSFSTEDDVNNLCSLELGKDWRALSRHDGSSLGSLSAKGKFPSDFPNAWITVKDSPHDNCWDLRPDFEQDNDASN